MEMRIRIDNKKEIQAWFKLKPSQINRATRLSINQVTRELQKYLGGAIPRAAGTSVVGYRRVRARKKLASAKLQRRVMSAVTWLGTKKIPARFGGRMRNRGKGAMAGRHFFENAFVATMKNGYTSIFYRKPSGKLDQAMIDLPEAHAQVQERADWARGRTQSVLRSRLKVELAKKA